MKDQQTNILKNQNQSHKIIRIRAEKSENWNEAVEKNRNDSNQIGMNRSCGAVRAIFCSFTHLEMRIKVLEEQNVSCTCDRFSPQ